jgi:hypothetical protein
MHSVSSLERVWSENVCMFSQLLIVVFNIFVTLCLELVPHRKHLLQFYTH